MSNEAYSDQYDSDNVPKTKDFLTVIINGQYFGISIACVQDVLRAQTVTQVPMAPPEIAGSLNLRGRIVTAINAHSRLGVGSDDDKKRDMSVVVEHDNELYSLIIDNVGDVLSLKNSDIQPTPVTLDPVWKDISAGIYRMKNELLVIMDVPKFLDSVHS